MTINERKLVDVLNGTRTDIVREVRSADGILHNIVGALGELDLDNNPPLPLTWKRIVELLGEARSHLARVTD